MHIRHLFLITFVIAGCNESHLTMTTDAGPIPMGDAAVAPDAYVAPSTPDAGFYVWPDSGSEVPDAFVAPDAAALGHYEFCGDTPQHIGLTGCCAVSGVFPTADHVETGMLIKGSGPAIYYMASDGRRYIFPTTHQLASWFLDPSRDVPFGEDTFACTQVVQITDALLASIWIGGNATYRPGVITTGITTDPKRYVVDRGATLRWIEDVTYDLNLAEPWLDGRDVYIADSFFVNYCIGLQAQSSSSTYGVAAYNGLAAYDAATLDDEVLRPCGY